MARVAEGGGGPGRIIDLALGFWRAQVVMSAVDLGVFTALDGAPADLAALSARIGLAGRSARDFLDALVALDLLELRDGLYRNAPEADRYLVAGRPGYVGGMLAMANRRLYPFWGSLAEALRTGLPQNEIKDGPDAGRKLHADPERSALFVRAMTGFSRAAAGDIADAFPWADHRTFVDVGCAEGGATAEIAHRFPHLSGIGYDLPMVRPYFEALVEAEGLVGRLRFQPGNFFKEALPEADVLMMGNILLNWDLDQKRTLIAKAYEALPPGGALIAYDWLVAENRTSDVNGLLMSLNMLIETPGGFMYTGGECSAWMREAGFGETRVAWLTGHNAMVVGIK